MKREEEEFRGIELIMKKFIIMVMCFCILANILGCSQNTTSGSGGNNDLTLQKESKHFKFYCLQSDKKCIDDLSKNLEDNYSRITGDLKVSLASKVQIEIYPDLKSYHVAMGMPDAPDWVVGNAWGNMIKIVSPLNPGKQYNYESIMQVIVHEFTHVVTGNINSLNKIPIWLSEGIATYEAKQMSDSNRTFIKTLTDQNKIPSISEMTQSNFADLGGYQLSYTIIEYIVKDYGYDAVISIMKNPNGMEKILGISMTEFENKWMTYLKANYR